MSLILAEETTEAKLILKKDNYVRKRKDQFELLYWFFLSNLSVE